MGNSNREIADALGVEINTIESHVHSILTALGFRRRSQIAAWWVSEGEKIQETMDE
jgi:DNA-binding NarL/FixJ family response regulator